MQDTAIWPFLGITLSLVALSINMTRHFFKAQVERIIDSQKSRFQALEHRLSVMESRLASLESRVDDQDRLP